MEKHIEAREARQQAAGRWLEVLGALAPALEPALSRVGRHVPCPVHGGIDGFRLFRDADQTGIPVLRCTARAVSMPSATPSTGDEGKIRMAPPTNRSPG